MAHDQPLRRFGAALIKVKRAPDRHHQGQQQEGETNAEYGEKAAPLVAKCALSDKASKRHRWNPDQGAPGGADRINDGMSGSQPKVQLFFRKLARVTEEKEFVRQCF